MKPTARTCEVCGKPKAVTWYRAQVDGRTVSVRAHLKCFLKWRTQQAGDDRQKGGRA